jgi:hypothetical protein
MLRHTAGGDTDAPGVTFFNCVVILLTLSFNLIERFHVYIFYVLPAKAGIEISFEPIPI